MNIIESITSDQHDSDPVRQLNCKTFDVDHLAHISWDAHGIHIGLMKYEIDEILFIFE